MAAATLFGPVAAGALIERWGWGVMTTCMGVFAFSGAVPAVSIHPLFCPGRWVGMGWDGVGKEMMSADEFVLYSSSGLADGSLRRNRCTGLESLVAAREDVGYTEWMKTGWRGKGLGYFLFFVRQTGYNSTSTQIYDGKIAMPGR